MMQQISIFLQQSCRKCTRITGTIRGNAQLSWRRGYKPGLTSLCTQGNGGWGNPLLLYKPQPKWADLRRTKVDPIFGSNTRYGPQ